MTRIDEGQSLTLKLRNGRTLSGVFESVQDLSEAEYAKYYAEMTGGGYDRPALPSLGQTVSYTTSLDANKVWEGNIQGLIKPFLFQLEIKQRI